MKRILLLSVLSLFAFATAFSQGTIKNNSYFDLSWNRAISDYGTIEGQETSKNLRQFYTDKYGDDLKHYSGALNVGSNFYIHPIGWLIEGFKAGLTLDFIDLGVDYYRFSDSIRSISGVDGFGNSLFTYDKANNYNDLTVHYSFNIGVVATISPAKNFYIDLTAKLCPTFAVNYFRIPCYQLGYKANSVAYERRNVGKDGYAFPEEDAEGNSIDINNVGTIEEEDTGIGLGLDYAFGFNIRYSKVFVGCEWVLGNIKYSYDVWEEQKLNNQQLKIKVGLSFE